VIVAADVYTAAGLWCKDAGAPLELVPYVEAWILVESGGQILRDNPLNLHSAGGLAGQIGAAYVSSADPDVAIFDSLAAGVAAAVRNLVRPWPGGAAEALEYGYTLVLARARAGDGSGFLAALAASSWSADRYGTKNGGANVLTAELERIIPPPSNGGSGSMADKMPAELATGIGSDLDYIANKLNAGATGLAPFSDYLSSIRSAVAQLVADVPPAATPVDPTPAPVPAPTPIVTAPAAPVAIGPGRTPINLQPLGVVVNGTTWCLGPQQAEYPESIGAVVESDINNGTPTLTYDGVPYTNTVDGIAGYLRWLLAQQGTYRGVNSDELDAAEWGADVVIATQNLAYLRGQRSAPSTGLPDASTPETPAQAVADAEAALAGLEVGAGSVWGGAPGAFVGCTPVPVPFDTLPGLILAEANGTA
jgi:hypothetical protein